MVLSLHQQTAVICPRGSRPVLQRLPIVLRWRASSTTALNRGEAATTQSLGSLSDHTRTERPRSRPEPLRAPRLSRVSTQAGMPLRGDRIHRYVNAFCPLCHEDKPDRPLAGVRRLSGWLVERDDRIWLYRV